MTFNTRLVDWKHSRLACKITLNCQNKKKIWKQRETFHFRDLNTMVLGGTFTQEWEI